MLQEATVKQRRRACKITTRKAGDILIGCFLMSGLICRMFSRWFGANLFFLPLCNTHIHTHSHVVGFSGSVVYVFLCIHNSSATSTVFERPCQTSGV